MSSFQKMQRKQSKFIYDFLPYNTFNHAHCNISGRIMTMHHKKDKRGRDVDPGVPKAYLIERIHARTAPWPNSEDIRDDLTYSDTELVIPNGASYHIYPNTFECGSCRSITTFSRDDIEAVSGANVDPTGHTVCHNCSARLTDSHQLPFVCVCECGAISDIWVPECCDAGMRLERDTSTMSRWYWLCADESCTEDSGSRNSIPFFAEGVSTDCPNGDCDNEQMDTINHTASRAFYPQVYNLVNVRPELDDLHDNPRYRAKIVSDYLLGENEAGPSDHDIRQEAADILGGASALVSGDHDEVEEAMEEARDRLSLDMQAHRRKMERWLNNEYNGNPTSLAEGLYEYLSVVHPDYAPKGGIEATSFREMVDNNAEDTHLDLSVVKEFNKRREGLNLDEVRLIKNFPITAVTYGYSRLASEPPEHQRNPAVDDENATEEAGKQGEDGDGDGGGDGDDRPVELNLFHRGEHAEPQLYIQNNDAEAVMVQFDKEAVIEWLVSNGVLTDSELIPDTDDDEELRGWFIEHVSPPGRYDGLPDHGIPDTDETISRYCYTLLNTTSHLFINGMGALAGHQHASLVERLMPNGMAFVVYKRPDTDFQLGSLWTLFEEQFDDFTEHLDELYDCSLDPVCMDDENGACEDCLYLAAISTENANYNLSRSVFYGGPFDDRADIAGYQDIDV
jgi:hypothetical protein